MGCAWRHQKRQGAESYGLSFLPHRRDGLRLAIVSLKKLIPQQQPPGSKQNVKSQIASPVSPDLEPDASDRLRIPLVSAPTSSDEWVRLEKAHGP
jgi:hypothetical protein